MEKISSNGLVLEIGSGNQPNPRSDILCDKFIHDNSQRAGKFSIVIDRPLVIADGYKLPFLDKYFDFVISSHILEHLEDPSQFINQITRVSKYGYIEVPSILSERLFGWKFHLWHIVYLDNVIHFYPKNHGPMFNNKFHNLIHDKIWYRRFFEENEDLFYEKIYWKDNIKILIHKSPLPNKELQKYNIQITKLHNNIKQNKIKDLYFLINWYFRRIRKKITKELRVIYWNIKCLLFKDAIISRISKIIVCPNCLNRLQLNNYSIKCTKCKQNYYFDYLYPNLVINK